MKRILIFLAVICLLIPVSMGMGRNDETQETAIQTGSRQKPVSAEECLSVGTGLVEVDYLYETMEQKLGDSDYAVYCEVVDYGFYVDGTYIYTLEKVRVLEPLYGDITAGKELTVYKGGGYMIAKDYIHYSYDNEEDRIRERNSKLFSGCSDEELETKFIGMIPEGYFSPEIGERKILFLYRSENFEDTYELTGGSIQGEINEITDGQLKSYSFHNELEDPEILEKIQTIPLEEYKQWIKEARSHL